MATSKYLVALNDIFERTLLGSKTRFFHAEGTGIQRLDGGFQYFWDWAEQLVSAGEFMDGVHNTKFIAWQVHTYVLIHNNTRPVLYWSCLL